MAALFHVKVWTETPFDEADLLEIVGNVETGQIFTKNPCCKFVPFPTRAEAQNAVETLHGTRLATKNGSSVCLNARITRLIGNFKTKPTNSPAQSPGTEFSPPIELEPISPQSSLEPESSTITKLRTRITSLEGLVETQRLEISDIRQYCAELSVKIDRLLPKKRSDRYYDCSLCKEPHDLLSDDGSSIFRPKSCQHQSCVTAMARYVVERVENNRLPIRCPVCLVDFGLTVGNCDLEPLFINRDDLHLDEERLRIEQFEERQQANHRALSHRLSTTLPISIVAKHHHSSCNRARSLGADNNLSPLKPFRHDGLVIRCPCCLTDYQRIGNNNLALCRKCEASFCATCGRLFFRGYWEDHGDCHKFSNKNNKIPTYYF